jgi:anti-sigma regulatory factor (Ser/Thr protein kinase)
MIVGTHQRDDQEGFGMPAPSITDTHDLTRTMPERAHLELGAIGSAVPTARRWARVVLSEWNLARLADDGELILSEFVTNSVRHASGLAVHVWLLSDRNRLVIMVSDTGHGMPVRAKTEDTAALAGRGLVIVGALAADWGAYRTPKGKVVWALLT